uniref:Uncharacterized protein n=1 Tax=Manihot esculenta TaxID=3983 RepID=A0A2C9UZ09_MANES
MGQVELGDASCGSVVLWGKYGLSINAASHKEMTGNRPIHY